MYSPARCQGCLVRPSEYKDRETHSASEIYADEHNNASLARSYAAFMGKAFADKIKIHGTAMASSDYGTFRPSAFANWTQNFAQET